MFNRHNMFKKTLHDLDDNKEIPTKEQKDLTDFEKKQLFNQTRMYIQIQDIVHDLQNELIHTEEIVGFLPFTNEQNSNTATAGLTGMTYVTTEKAIAYRDTFGDLRGNRVAIFTNERIIFMTIIEFLEDHIFYSYYYPNIQAIRLEKHKVGYFDWQKGRIFPKRKHHNWYTLDFQHENHVFTEMLNSADARRFTTLVGKIPKLANVTISEKMHRDTKFDFVFSNIKLGVIAMNTFFIIIFVLFVLYLLYGIITGKGGFGYLASLPSSHTFLEHFAYSGNYLSKFI